MKNHFFSRFTKFLCLAFSWLLLSNCSNTNQFDIDVENEIAQLHDGEAKFIVFKNKDLFYPKATIFSGKVMAGSSSIRANMYDNKGSNIILAIMANDWYRSKEKIFKVTSGESTNLNIMFGKMIDPKKNRGKGYLLMDGSCEILSFSKELYLVKFKGLASDYMKMNQRNEWEQVQGYLIVKMPEYEFFDLNEDSFFEK